MINYEGINQQFQEGKKQLLLRPNRKHYIIQELSNQLIFITIGIFISIVQQSSAGLIFSLFGLYNIRAAFKISDRIYYVLNEKGIHINNYSLFNFNSKTIPYNTILHVKIDGVPWTNSKYHTVLIDTGKTYDGDPVYNKLIGLEYCLEITEIIKRMSRQ